MSGSPVFLRDEQGRPTADIEVARRVVSLIEEACPALIQLSTRGHFRGVTPRLLPMLLEDFIPNLVTNPLGMFRTGEFIRRADLVREVRSIARWGIPVTVAWSDRDGLVPRSAFDELRHAAGVDGVVVEGAHAWLIADPTAFGELAISALVDARAPLPRSAPEGSGRQDGLSA